MTDAKVSKKLSPEILLDKKLGEGSYGGVYRTSFPHIVTKISINHNDGGETSKNTSPPIKEAAILRMLEGKRGILQSHGCKIGDASVNIKLDLQEGDIEKLMEGKSNYQDFSANIVKILEGIYQLHSMGIIHTDIKPQNILHAKIAGKENIAIADFGTSEISPSATLSPLHPHLGLGGGGGKIINSLKQTVWWRAPEIAQAQLERKQRIYASSKIDMWSLGIIFQSMASRTMYPEVTVNDNKDLLEQYNIYYKPTRSFSSMTTEAFDGDEKELGKFKLFLNSLLCIDEKKRLDIVGALNSPYIMGINGGRVYPKIDTAHVISNWIAYNKLVHSPKSSKLNCLFPTESLIRQQTDKTGLALGFTLPSVHANIYSYHDNLHITHLAAHIYYTLLVNTDLPTSSPTATSLEKEEDAKETKSLINQLNGVAYWVAHCIFGTFDGTKVLSAFQRKALNLLDGYFFYATPGNIFRAMMLNYENFDETDICIAVEKLLYSSLQYAANAENMAAAAIDVVINAEIKTVKSGIISDLAEYQKMFMLISNYVV